MLCLLQTSSSSKKELAKISTKLLKKGLVACTQIGKVKSSYVWKGSLCVEKEFLLTCKMDSKNLKKAQKLIKKMHHYDLPEIIAIPISHASRGYKKWLLKTCK